MPSAASGFPSSRSPAPSTVAEERLSRVETDSPSLYGYSREFTAEELAELYPDRNAFLSKYDAALEIAVKSGVVLAEEATGMRMVAKKWATRLPMAGGDE